MFSVTQAVRRAAQVRGAAVASICGGRTRTWTDFEQRVARMASALVAGGLREGDRVCLLALNSDSYLETFFATLWAGGIIVPLNTRWAIEELLRAGLDCDPSVLVFDDHLAERALAVAPRLALKQLIYCGEKNAPPQSIQQEDLIAASTPIPDAARGGGDPAGIFYTGGTTGAPKGVMLSHDNLISSALVNGSLMAIGEESVFLHVAPMFHIADTCCLLATTLSAGTHVSVPGFDPATLTELVQRSGVTHALMVPTMIAMLLDHSEASGQALPRIGHLTYGAAPMPDALMRRILAAMPWARLMQGYGQTEMSPGISVLEPQYHVLSGPKAGKLGSAGRPVPTVDVKVVDRQGMTVEPGAVGEIWARGPNTMLGYWNQPDATRQALVDGWVRTGDAGYFDSDGFLFVVDRLKDMIISGGENIYSAEVENALSTHASVASCAVIGVADPLWGERVHAVVELRPGAELGLEDAIAHCRLSIAGFKCPRSLETRNGPLPISGAGKVLKTVLREQFDAAAVPSP